MVGVQPCIDKVSGNIFLSFYVQLSLQSVIESSVANPLTATLPNKSLGAMRPLTAAYHASQSQNEVNGVTWNINYLFVHYRLYLLTPTHPRKMTASYPKQWNIFLAGNIFKRSLFIQNTTRFFFVN